jgi:hypothetical protein
MRNSPALRRHGDWFFLASLRLSKHRIAKIMNEEKWKDHRHQESIKTHI